MTAKNADTSIVITPATDPADAEPTADTNVETSTPDVIDAAIVATEPTPDPDAPFDAQTWYVYEQRGVEDVPLPYFLDKPGTRTSKKPPKTNAKTPANKAPYRILTSEGGAITRYKVDTAHRDALLALWLDAEQADARAAILAECESVTQDGIGHSSLAVWNTYKREVRARTPEGMRPNDTMLTELAAGIVMLPVSGRGPGKAKTVKLTPAERTAAAVADIFADDEDTDTDVESTTDAAE